MEGGIDYCQQRAQKKMRLDVLVKQADGGISLDCCVGARNKEDVC
jgi:hypothetical protein